MAAEDFVETHRVAEIAALEGSPAHGPVVAFSSVSRQMGWPPASASAFKRGCRYSRRRR